jgi:hypothetical protein
MPTRPIKITGSDIKTEKLVLDDHDHTVADQGDTIEWQIAKGSGVFSISIVPKPGAAKIWQKAPGPQGNVWSGDISPTAPKGAMYGYSINWRAFSGGPEMHYDPLISIKPTLRHKFKRRKLKLIGLLLSLLAFLSISIFFLEKKKD